jgi:hypothetical protein
MNTRDSINTYGTMEDYRRSSHMTPTPSPSAVHPLITSIIIIITTATIQPILVPLTPHIRVISSQEDDDDDDDDDDDPLCPPPLPPADTPSMSSITLSDATLGGPHGEDPNRREAPLPIWDRAYRVS